MGKIVLITGAGRGLGLAFVKLHLDRGDMVYAYEIDETNELAELQSNHPDNLRAYICDIGNTASVESAMAEIISTEGKSIYYTT